MSEKGEELLQCTMFILSVSDLDLFVWLVGWLV